MKYPKPLTRVDVTHRKPTDPGVLWLIANGFYFIATFDRVFLECERCPTTGTEQ